MKKMIVRVLGNTRWPAIGKISSLVTLFLIIVSSLFAQEHTVMGIVVSSDDNKALPGVTVRNNNNPSLGTITDEDGRYVISATSEDSLIFAFIGFESKKFIVKNQRTINVTLNSLSTELDQVQVIAFGKKKRDEMVGSVTSVNPADLKIPSSNLTTALAGRVAGMIGFQRSGEPGLDNAEFFIRGVTTFGFKRDPLILVDGIEMTTTDLARLNVDDIENFSILKDATASAVYGSRAANGVILITTKEGEVGKVNLSFRFENSLSEPTKNIELADPVTYMKLGNEAVRTRDRLGVLLYSDRKIDNTEMGTNSVVYPANDWRKIMLKNITSNQRAHLSVNGGGGVARYYVSGTFNNDNGLMKVDGRNNFNNNINLKTYELRSNVNIDLTKTTELIVRLSGTFDDYTGPIEGGAEMYNMVMHTNPVLFPAYYPVDSQHMFVNHIMFGNFDEGQYANPYAGMVRGYKQYSRSLMLAQLELKQSLDFITSGLSFDAMVNTTRRSYFDVVRAYNPFWYTLQGYNQLDDTYFIKNINPEGGTEYLGYSEGPKDVSTTFYLESRINYARDFQKHGLEGLLVVMAQQDLNANAGNLQLSLPSRNFGVSGRLGYNYDKRYFFEFNFGYNGSERFDKKHRFGLFPSIGGAWTVSNEDFFKELKPIVSNLRLRTTYGLIGNDAIGSPNDRFFYLSQVNMNDGGRGATFGRVPGSTFHLDGVSISRYANPGITWERAKINNYSIGLGLLDRVNIEAEYFNQKRDNILMTRASIPAAIGFSAAIQANLGEVSSEGWDISLDYDQVLNENIWFKGMANFTYSSNKYTSFEEPNYKEPWRSHVGQPINQTYGYIAERLFVDDEEAKNSPPQNFGEYGGGDIKYLDVNDDGQITEADKVPIGYPTVPEITYGFGISLGIHNFDFSVFFQGLGNESFWIDPSATWPFNNQTQLLKAYSESFWSEGKRDINALFPRLSSGINSNDVQTSTWWMRNGSFLRLKQLELGYNIPAQILRRIHLSNCRVYLNASNLFSWSHFNLWDVEMGGNGLGYPIQRVFNIGINLNIN